MTANERWVFAGRAPDPDRLVWMRVELPAYRHTGPTYYVARPERFWPQPVETT